MARKVPSRIREVEKNTQYATEQVFQIQCPSWSAALDLERELHGKFKSKRVKSEWFSLDHRDIVEIEDQHKATEVDLSQGAPILVRCYAGEKRLAENLTKCPNVKVIVTVRVPEEWTGVLKGGKWLSWNVREAIKWWMNKRTERV